MINVSKYPYAIAKLYKKIEKEDSFLTKYFFLLDLFSVIVNYLYLISVSFTNEKEVYVDYDIPSGKISDSISIEHLEKIMAILSVQTNSSNGTAVSEYRNNIFIPELRKLKQSSAWNIIFNFSKKKNKELEKKLGSETYYKKLFAKSFTELEYLLEQLYFLTKYTLIVPFQFKEDKKKFSFLPLTGTNILLKKISYYKPMRVNLQSLYLMKTDSHSDGNNTPSLFELKPKIFTSEFIEPNYTLEDLVNSLNKFLIGSDYLNIKINLTESEVSLDAKTKLQFISLMNEIETAEIKKNRFKSSNKNISEKIRYFFGLLAIAKEGYNKTEIKNILTGLQEEDIDFYIDKAGSFLLNVDGRYKIVSELIENFCLSTISREELITIHNKVINYFQPWDKKVSSLTLKYLPYHYLEANRIDELKNLFETNFVKSKFKIYPQETLEDIKQLIKYYIRKQPENLADLTKYCFMYQKFKEETKKELVNIVDLCHTKQYTKALSKVEYINKPMEKFYQLLLITFLMASANKLLEAKNTLKTLRLIPDVYINQYNSELIFFLCGDISSNGVLDVINIPRSKEDGINLIKNIRDSSNTSRLIDVLLKLLDAIPSDLDKAVMLEALIVKVSELNTFSLVEKFFGDVMPLIEKVENINLKDKLYYTYLTNMLKKPQLYRKLFGTILEKKDEIQTPLFKFLFYANLALMFMNLNHAKISKDYILFALNIIRDTDNINYQSFMFTSMISGLKYFEKKDFFNELIDDTISLVSQTSFSYEKIERSLTLLNSLKSYDKEIELLKNLLKDLSEIKEKNISPLLYPYLKAVDRIKDKRIKNPLLKKLVNLVRSHNTEVKITLYSLLLLLVEPNESNYELLINELESDFLDTSKENAYQIILDNIALSKEQKYSEMLIEYFLNKIFNLNNENSSVELILKLLKTLNSEAIFPNKKNFIDKVFMLANLLSPQQKLKTFVILSIILFNIQEKVAALNLLHKLFSLLIKESDENRFIVINYLFNNLNNIKDTVNINDFLCDLLTNTYNLLPYIKKEEFLVKIISDIFSNIVKFTNFSDLKNVFYKTLGLTNRINNAVYKENIIGIIRYHLTNIKDRNILVDILQKSIIVSEENFKQANIKILSLISIAGLNEQSGNIELATRIFMSILVELRFFNYEEYTSEIMIYFAENLSRFSDKERAVKLFISLILSENGLQDDKYLNKIYSEIAINISKLGDINLILPIFELLLDKSLKIRNESLKVDYLIKLLSYVTNFGLSEKTKPLIIKILNLKKFITENENLALFFRAFIISLNKLNTKEISFYLEEIENSLDSITDNYLKAGTISLIATAYFKYDLRSGKNNKKSENLFDQAIKYTRLIYDLQNQVEYLADLSIKLFTIGKTDSAKYLMEHACSIFDNIKDENQKFNNISTFLHKFSQLRSIKKNKLYFANFFEKITNFENRIILMKVFIMLGQTYYKFNEQEYAVIYFNKAKSTISSLNETSETIELMISLGIAMLQCNDIESGNNLLKDTLISIRIKPKKVRAELSVKLFNSLIPLSELQYEKEVFNQVIRLVDELFFEDLNENELFTLGYTYGYKNKIPKFNEVLSFMKSKANRERLLRSVVSIFKEREDFSTLISLLPEVLDDSKTLDYILSALLSLVNDPEQTKKITDTVIIY